MMPPVIYMAQGEKTSPLWCWAFAKGCGGTNVVDTTSLLRGDAALFGSPKLWNIVERVVREQRRFYYGDHGYFGRGDYYRITLNDFQHDGTGDASPKRFEEFGKSVKPWRKTGRHILICPPGPIFGVLWGFNVELWLSAVQEKLRAFTDRPIVIRRKPKRMRMSEPISLDLKDAWALVTWRSNTAVDALLEGVPVFPTGKCAASRMGLADLAKIDEPFYPDDREQFAWNLADQQWTLEEMKAGQAWDALRPKTRIPGGS